MAERVYPSSKASPAMPPPSAAPKPKPPPPQQLYNPNLNPTRPRPVGPYRPNSKRSRASSCSPRRFLCLCVLYTLILLLSLLLLAAIAASVFYVLYHPKHPTFSVLAVKISSFNLSTPAAADFSHLSSSLSFTLSTKNPNSKLSFLYDPSAVSLSADGLPLGNASLPAFTHSPSNTTILRASLATDPAADLDPDSAASLKADLARKSGFPITVQMDTNVLVRMGKLSSKKVGIRVVCDGIRGSLPKQTTVTTPAKKGKKAATTTTTTPALASLTAAKCKVDLRIKIWKFTF